MMENLYSLGCSGYVVAGILLLTGTDGQTPYDQHIKKIMDSGNEDAMRVKLYTVMDYLPP